MGTMLTMLSVPLTVFMVIVAPIWLILHYRAKQRLDAGLAESEREQLHDLLVRGEQLKQRVQALETILDAEVPGWRGRL
ncbi:MAG: envelope stress response membrane protein PspB [Aeromonas sp.]